VRGRQAAAGAAIGPPEAEGGEWEKMAGRRRWQCVEEGSNLVCEGETRRRQCARAQRAVWQGRGAKRV